MSRRIARIAAFGLRAPSPQPVVTAFGVMDSRPALLVRVEDSDGAYGWGEAWCNFPAHGLEHGMRLLEDCVAPWYLGRSADEPPALLLQACEAFRRLAIQCGEPGPFAALVAGLDCALFDLAARRAGVSLARLLGGEPRPLPAYASGINPTRPETRIEAARARGYRAFKLKIGFADDDRNLRVLSDMLTGDETLLVDANQAWEPAVARRRIPEIAAFRVGWIEEPVPADHEPAVFAELASLAPVPLAGGENVRSRQRFARLLELRALGVVQPDCAKWGGISTCRQIAVEARAAGARFCPHYLGGAVGLLHSAHLLAAAGGDGVLEIDSNPNPLREALLPLPALADGRLPLPDGAGIGAEPAADVLAAYTRQQMEVHA